MAHGCGRAHAQGNALPKPLYPGEENPRTLRLTGCSDYFPYKADEYVEQWRMDRSAREHGKQIMTKVSAPSRPMVGSFPPLCLPSHASVAPTLSGWKSAAPLSSSWSDGVGGFQMRESIPARSSS